MPGLERGQGLHQAVTCMRGHARPLMSAQMRPVRLHTSWWDMQARHSTAPGNTRINNRLHLFVLPSVHRPCLPSDFLT